MATRWDNLPDPSSYDTRTAGRDVGAVKKALKPPSHVKGAALDMVKAAGRRGGTRLGGAAGLLQLSAEAGYAAGKKLDEETGVGKKIVDKGGLGDIVDKAVKKRDKVELSKSAKERLEDEEIDQIRRDTDSAEKARREYSGRREDGSRLPDDEPYKGDGMKRGGKVVKMASGGMTASRRADGIAQRGKTRGKMC